jgi:tRNA(fMet)-specific endonuclease VapC
MAGNFLVDTNILIAFFAGDRLVVSNFGKYAENLFVPITVLGELFYGAFNSSQRNSNLEKVDQLNIGQSISPEIETARIYGHIKVALRKIGKPIPDNDLWIAALAIQHDMTLVSRDQDFEAIQNLKLEKW